MKHHTTIIAEVVARFCFPFILLFALYLLLAGHNNPGGGFIAGVMASAAFALMYVVFGLEGVRRYTPKSYLGLVALGLTFATGTGLAGFFLGDSFLTSEMLHYDLPILGTGEIVSAFFFDVGVFFIVVGVTVSIMGFIGEEGGA
ncbi:MAG: MnhB domain-containing protein [Candidatus Methylomirabilales bacterium]